MVFKIKLFNFALVSKSTSGEIRECWFSVDLKY